MTTFKDYVKATWMVPVMIVVLAVTAGIVMAATADEIQYETPLNEEAIPLAREILAGYATRGIPKNDQAMTKLAKKAQRQAEIMIQYQREMLLSNEPDVY